MPETANTSELLFSYGTLPLEAIQLATFGRRLTGTPDELPGFAQSLMKIDDPEVVATSGKTPHPFATFTGRDADAIPGTVFHITRRSSGTRTGTKSRRTSASPSSCARALAPGFYVDARYTPAS